MPLTVDGGRPWTRDQIQPFGVRTRFAAILSRRSPAGLRLRNLSTSDRWLFGSPRQSLGLEDYARRVRRMWRRLTPGTRLVGSLAGLAALAILVPPLIRSDEYVVGCGLFQHQLNPWPICHGWEIRKPRRFGPVDEGPFFAVCYGWL